MNTQSFKENANWLQMLTQLIEDHQDYKDPEALEVLSEWMAERDYLRFDFIYFNNEKNNKTVYYALIIAFI